MRAVIQAVAGQAEKEPIVDLSAAATTPPAAAWAPIRAVKDLRDAP